MDINNAYEFFKNVKLTEDGYLIVSGSGGGGGTVEITINGNTYKIINAPNVENIRVIDQYDDEVGTIISGEVVVNIPQFVKPDVSINSTPYKEYESGAIDNILVKDQNGNEVGNLINGEWIVPQPTFTDVEISINGTQYKLYNSGDVDNILVVDQDGNQIGSLIGTEWTVNLPTFTDVDVSINSINMGSYGSGMAPNILVKDQNDNQVGSKSGSDWIVNIPTFTDAEISINGVFYDAYSSGQTDNILIVDQNTNQIGSLDLNSGNWVVNLPTFTKTKTSINGVEFNELDSGEVDNILVKDQDGNLIGSKILDEWIVNLPTFTDVELSINGTLIDTYGSGTTPNILVKDEDDNQVGSLVGGEWIVPSGGGGSGPTYVKSAMYTTSNIMYEIVDIYSDGSIKPNNMFDINSVNFNNGPRAYVADVNPNTGTLIVGGNFQIFSSYRTILRADGGSNILSAINGTSFTGQLSSGYISLSIYYDDINDVWFNVAQTGTNYPPPVRVFKSIDDGLNWTIINDNPVGTNGSNANSNNYQPLIGKIGSHYYYIHYYNNNITYIRYGTSMENAITTSSTASTFNSTDGTTIRSIVYGNGYYLILSNNILRRSTDGITFSNVSPNIVPFKIIFDDNNNKFVATYSDGIYTSDNGVTWTNVYATDYTNQINVYIQIHFTGVETIVDFRYVMLASTDLVNWYHKPGSPNMTGGVRYRDLSNLLP